MTAALALLLRALVFALAVVLAWALARALHLPVWAYAFVGAPFGALAYSVGRALTEG